MSHRRNSDVTAPGARALRPVPLPVRMLVVVLLVGAGAVGADAAIVFDTSSTTQDNATVVTWQHTVNPGLDRFLVVGVSFFSGTKTVASITYAGAPLSFIGAQNGGSGSNNRRVELWGLANPLAGTGAVVMTASGGTKAVYGAASFFGVDPLAPTGGFHSGQGTGTTASLTVASAATEVVMDCISTKGSAEILTVGAGQTEMWNSVSRSNGGNAMGAGSWETGAASTAMTWSLQSGEYWVLGAIRLLPAAPRLYVPDAMVKLFSEPAGAYRFDAIYESTASLQVAANGVLNGVAASYHILFENDGSNPDQHVISGTGSDSEFVVQYLDGGGVDRTAAVTGGGYTDALLAPGGSTVWTINVTPQLGTIGGTAYTVTVTAVSTGDPLFTDQVAAVTTSISPNLAVTKSVDLAAAAPGQDITYTLVATSTPGLDDATTIVVADPLPAESGFRLGSVTFDPGTTSLTAAVVYSDDNGATWTYAPVSGGCGAPAGYDYCVTNVRWELTGAMPADQTFTVSFATIVR